MAASPQQSVIASQNYVGPDRFGGGNVDGVRSREATID